MFNVNKNAKHSNRLMSLFYVHSDRLQYNQLTSKILVEKAELIFKRVKILITIK